MQGLWDFKKHIFSHLKYGKAAFIGKPFYHLLIFLELLGHRLAGSFRRVDLQKQSALNKELTAIIKTFERPRLVRRLVKSIRKFYPELPIILVDDSKNPSHIKGIETVIMPYDSGVSAGRNKALEHVKTDYFLLLDDDYIFIKATDLEKPFIRMKANPNIDIMGGKLLNLPFYKSIDYSRESIHPTKARPTMPHGSRIDGMPVFDKVANFFIGRTDSVRKVGWDNLIKFLDHADFFTRSKGILTTVYNEELKCLHAQSHYKKKFKAVGSKIAMDRNILYLKYYNHKKLNSNQIDIH